MNESILSLLPKIKDYMEGKPIKKAWLFGSCSRGEETASSDIDILVDYDDSAGVLSLFQIGAILSELRKITGRKVDLVESQGLKEFARMTVEQDKVLIYERKD